MRLHHVLPFVVAVGSGIAVWACGSDELGSDLTSQSDGGASSSSSSSSGATSSTSSSGSSGTASDGGSGDAGDGGSSGALGGDGGVDPPDAGPGGSTTSITCGATSCALPAQQCCASQVPGPGNLGWACVAASDAGCPPPPGGGDVTSLKCSAQANCPTNTVCCVRQTNDGAASECKASCTNNEAQLCDPNAVPTGCSQQNACSSKNIGDWGLPNTYATCGGKGN